jgi:hypothetical protein
MRLDSYQLPVLKVIASSQPECRIRAVFGFTRLDWYARRSDRLDRQRLKLEGTEIQQRTQKRNYTAGWE